MPFTIRPIRHAPLQCAVTYRAGSVCGQGTVWNFSQSGWKLSGDLSLHIGQHCSLTVTLPEHESIVVAAAIVRWVRGQEYGLENVVVEKEMHSRLNRLLTQLVQDSFESIP